MAGLDDRRLFEDVDIPEDTCLLAWPAFLLEAVKRYRFEGFAAGMGGLALGGIVAVIMMLGVGLEFMFVSSIWLVIALLFAAVVMDRWVTRKVYIITPTVSGIDIDEQRWWRRDEQKIPSEFKKPDGKGYSAWLYPVAVDPTDVEAAGEDGNSGTPLAAPNIYLTPFDAWAEPLEIKDKEATSAHVAGIRTTMHESENVGRHQESDGREVAKWGMMAVFILSGLLAVYLAGSQALDTFSR